MRKKSGRHFGLPDTLVFEKRLQTNDVGGLRALGTLRNFELDLLAFFQRTEAVSQDGGVVHKHIIAAVLCNKTITLFCAKPLDFASHERTSYLWVEYLKDPPQASYAFVDSLSNCMGNLFIF